MKRAAAGGAPAVPFGPADVAVAIAMNILWGMNIVAMKATVTATAPFTAGVVRLVAVAVLCAPWLWPPTGRMRLLAVFGLVNGGLFLLFLNLALSVASNVGALAIGGQLSVPIALVLSALFLAERMSRMQAVGVALAFAGVVLLVFDRRIFAELPGLALMLVAATAWAVSSLIQRRLAGVAVLTLYFWTGLMGAALLLPLAVLREPAALWAVPHLDAGPIGWFAFSVLGATLAGQGGMAWLLGRHPVSAIMPLTLAAPVVSVIASHLVFGAAITLPMIVGGLVTLAGVLVVTLSRRRASAG